MASGDPRVHFAMNLVLSAGFVYLVLRGLAFVGAVEFSLLRLAIGTAALMLITYAVTA